MKGFELVSERLRFRLIQLSDLNSIHELHSLAETDTYNTLGIPKDIESTKSIIEPWISENQKTKICNYTFAIERKENQKFIGLIALKLGSEKFKNAEVWYKLHIDNWGQGYGTETLRRLIDFGFDKLTLHRIEAGCAIENIGSIRILEKAGMTREGHKRKVLPLKTGWTDNYEYAIIETDERK